jgi:hypothetical protein
MEAFMNKVLSFCLLALLSTTAWATPANTPTLDGRPIEYDATDLRGTFTGASTWGVNGTLSNLFVTWDQTNVYIALQAWQADNNKLVVLLDVDPDAGTGATTTTNWTSIDPSYIKYNDYAWSDGGGFGLDYMLASEGFYNNAIRINYDGVEVPSTNNTESLFDNGNGSTPAGTPVDMASLNDTTACLHKGFEARIPWAVLYAGSRFGTVETNEIVPRDASLRILAGIHNNNPDSAWSSPDTIPNQVAEDYTNGVVTSATYLDIELDTNHDGIPDMLVSDVNAPYIRAAAGAVGGSSVYVVFNEAVTVGTVENTAYWSVGGATPVSAVAQGSYGVLLGLAAPIASADLVLVRATGVEDASANSRTTEHCLAPAASGITQSVTVTFQVNTNSGMGISASHARPTAFYVNGESLPLEWGYPPLETLPLTPIPGSNGWVSATVVFPEGSASTLRYKYSGRISGTNNYEAVRLTDFSDAARLLVLNTNGAPMTVVDYMGAVAHPLRSPADTNLPSAHNRLYTDVRRGDAGVRVRREILFQLDLSLRKRDNLARVFVAGSDPLRGFNTTGENNQAASDFPGIYVFLDQCRCPALRRRHPRRRHRRRRHLLPPLGVLHQRGRLGQRNQQPLPRRRAAAVYFPNEIQGTEPYLGYGWTRPPLPPQPHLQVLSCVTVSGISTNSLESPSSNIEYYVADPDDTAQIVLAPFLWDNEASPRLRPPMRPPSPASP